ncbi:MAG: ABC transporter ATP-binding protein [Armatimonadetes bacterium]|nr:ABC transporter ATP-binding protein [Armatimonadota bacterium]
MSQLRDGLVVENLTKSFVLPDNTPLTVLDGISLEAEAGDTVAIVGPSGSGKSTLLNIIGGLEPPTNGTVRLGETDVTSLSGAELARYRAQRVGFIFQDHHLLPQLNALENVLVPTLAAPGIDGAEARAEELLDRLGLAARAEAFPARLSGGERQRVAVARALMNRPGLLLCDEPTGNLDRNTGEQIVALLLELARDEGATVLMVTHNLDQAARMGRTLALSDGKLAPLDTSPEAPA